jgi:hypothetical protein
MEAAQCHWLRESLHEPALISQVVCGPVCRELPAKEVECEGLKCGEIYLHILPYFAAR